MSRKIAWPRKTRNQNINAENIDENIDGLLAEAAYCMNNADEVLASVEVELAA